MDEDDVVDEVLVVVLELRERCGADDCDECNCIMWERVPGCAAVVVVVLIVRWGADDCDACLVVVDALVL